MANPEYILSAAPLEPAQFRNFFDSGRDSLMDMLANPKSFRYAGWNLETLDRTKIVDGEFLEVANGARKTLRLYEDGTLLLKAAADSTFLGWGRHANEFAQNPRLNSLAVIEISTEFVHFYARLVQLFIKPPANISFHVELKDAFIDGKKLYLNPGHLNSIAWQMDLEKHEVSKETSSVDIKVPVSTLVEDPNHVSYLLVQRLYLFFSVASNDIPYVDEQDGVRRVNPSHFSQR